MRVMVYDPTCVRSLGRPGLSKFWRAGAVLYGSVLRRFDAWSPARSWDEALRWIARTNPAEPIDEIQYWGHGKWGCALIDRDVFDQRALSATHSLNASLRAIEARMRGRDALFWFRTCETLGAVAHADSKPDTESTNATSQFTDRFTATSDGRADGVGSRRHFSSGAVRGCARA
jgi:hypothetical protein